MHLQTRLQTTSKYYNYLDCKNYTEFIPLFQENHFKNASR